MLSALTITKQGGVVSVDARIKDVRWAGLRLRVQVEGAPAGSLVDLRTKAADASSSVAAAPKTLSDEGTASLVVPDDTLEGSSVVLVVLDEQGRVLLKQATIVGEA